MLEHMVESTPILSIGCPKKRHGVQMVYKSGSKGLVTRIKELATMPNDLNSISETHTVDRWKVLAPCTVF